MSEWQGDLRKMRTELADTVRYTLFDEKNGLCLNEYLGQPLRLSYGCLLYTSPSPRDS